jgi:hypothetical protein
MRTWFRRFRDPILNCLHQILHRSGKLRKDTPRARKRPLLEMLEDRLAPASLTDVGGAVTIFLDNPNEALTISATATPHQYSLSSSSALLNAGLTGASYTPTNPTSGTLTLTSDNSIAIVDTSPGQINNSPSGTSVTFGNSGSNSYLDDIIVTLSNPLAGVVSFTGHSTFSNPLAIQTAHGSITSAAGSLISVPGSGSLVLQTPGNINLAGAVDVTGVTSLEANGTIIATAATNNFGATLDLEGLNGGNALSATVASAGALDLGNVNLTEDLTATAGGLLTSDGPIGVGGNLNVSTTSGSISLDSGNNITGTLSASVSTSGSDNITLGDELITGGMKIGTITLGTGTLQLDDLFSNLTFTPPNISEGTTGGITTSGNVIVTLGTSNENVLLNTAPNSIGGTVMIDGSGSGDLALRNTSSTASAAAISINGFSVHNLTLEFDSASAAINIDPNNLGEPVFFGYSNFSAFSANLTLIAGGAITEAVGGITVNGTSSFTSTGGDVTLDDPGNVFNGTISAAVSGSHNITLGNSSTTTTLGTISLGTGNLVVDDFESNTGSSSILEDPTFKGISMAGTSATATFNIQTDTSVNIDLSGPANDLAPGVSVVINGVSPGSGGPTSGNFGLRNTNAGASVSQVMLTNFTVQGLTLQFDNASISIDTSQPVFAGFSPAANSTNSLTIASGGGISQTAGVATSGIATFTGLGSNSKITLDDTTNALTGVVSFNTPAADSQAVSFTNSVGIVLGGSSLGTGPLTITADTGNIGEFAGITQAAGAGNATFDAVAGTVINLVPAFPPPLNFFTGQVIFQGSAVKSISIEDSNPAHNLSNYTLPTSPSALTGYSVTLDSPVASIVLPASNVSYDFTLIVTNDIVLPAASTFTDAGSLTLTSSKGNLNLLGVINVTGATATTTLQANGTGSENIDAENAANHFGASLNLSNSSFGTTKVVSAGNLALGNVNTPSSPLTVTALSGSITQASGTSIDAGAASFITSTGAILLSESGNTFGGAVSLSVSSTRADNIVLNADNSSNLQLGTIVLGAGTLSVSNTSTSDGSGIEENTALGGISTASGSTATLAFSVAAANADVLLNGAPNNLPAGVHVSIVGAATGTTGSIGFRNVSPLVSPNIPLSQVTMSNFMVNDETIEFDNAAINVANPININGVLSLTAGGPISQASTADITASGASFSVLGNFGITLTDNANSVTGPVQFSDPKADNTRPVSFINAGAIMLDSSSLGLGTFSVTALGAGGDITEVGGSTITQKPGAGSVTLTAGGTTLDLSGGSENDLPGAVTFTGSSNSLTTIGFENNDPLATLPAISGLAATQTSVTINLDSAPVALSSFNTATLNVMAGGNISQQSGSTLTVTGHATFFTGFAGIQLGNNNSFNVVTLVNSGQNAVSLTSTNTSGLVIENWSLGSGPVTVTSSGAITESGNSTGLVQTLIPNKDYVAGSVSLSAGGNSILLDNSSNQLLGPVVLSTTGSGNATIVNSGSLVLGTDGIGGGLSLTVSGTGSITQAPGTSITVGGVGYFSAGSISLDNAGNSIGGAISLNTSSGDATLSLTGATQGTVQLAASTVAATLTLTTSAAISQLPGLFGTPNDGVLNAHGASFTAGGNIALTNSSNNFNDLPVALSASIGSVSLTDSNQPTDLLPGGLVLGPVTFGSGGLTLIASGPVSQDPTFAGSSSPIVGSGSISISAANPASPIDVTLDSPGNDITGASSTFTLTNAASVTLANQGNINLTGGLTVPTSAEVTLSAGGSVTLPAGTLTLGSLTVSAHDTTVNTTTLTAKDSTGGLSFTGIVNFDSPSAVTLDTSAGGSIFFGGNVTDNEDLKINLPSHGALILTSGTWNITSHNLTINGAGVQFNIGGTFRTNGGTLAVTGTPAGGGSPSTGNAINVNSGGTFEVDGASTVTDGGSGSVLAMNFLDGTLLVNLAAPASLTFNTPNGPTAGNASDAINLTSAKLSGFGGTAPSGSTTVFTINGGGGIVGSFNNPTDSQGNFLMGTDIVKATITHNTVSIQPGGTVISSGTVTMNEPDGDSFTVKLTGGSGLLVVPTSALSIGHGLEIVVRNASSASTLTITTTKNGGDGFTAVTDIVFDGTGPATINAATTNVSGNMTIAGPLTTLTLNNFTNGTLTAGGTSSNSTTITGNLFSQDSITLGSQLSKLTLAQFSGGSQSTISAASFGTITTKGNAAQALPGDFKVNLVDTGNNPTTAVASATIKGTLGGNWDLAGSVGSAKTGVTATATNNWHLGVANGPGVVNAGKLTNVGTLKLGTANFVTILASGNVSTLQATSLSDWGGTGTDVTGVLQAGSFGSIQITGNPAANDHGNLIANITATGSSGANALGSLSVAGDLGASGINGAGNPAESTLLFDNGNVGSITVGRSIHQVTLDALSTSTGGGITTITAGAVKESTLDARSIGTLKVVGNLSDQLFGDFLSSTVTLTGTAGMTTAALGSFSTTRDVGTDPNNFSAPSSSFTITNGGIGTFTVGGKLSNTTIDVQSATNGNVGTISAAQWEFSPLTARTIGTIKVTGRAAATASTQAFNGDLLESTMIAFEAIGQSTPGIGTLSVAGKLSSNSGDYLLANNGITSFTVGRNVSTYQVSTNLNGGTGGIGTLTAGEWDSTDIAAAFLGATTIKGFATAEQPKGFTNGDFTNSDVVLTGSSGKVPLALASLSVQDNLTSDSFSAPAGIGSLSATGMVSGVTLALLNALSATSGTMGNFTAGQVQDLTLSANSATKGTIKTTGSAALGLGGDFTGSTVAVAGFTGSSATPVGLAGFSVAGSVLGAKLEVKDSIPTITVGHELSDVTIAAAYYHANTSAAIKTITVGAWFSTTLIANSVGTFTVSGNAGAGIVGSLTDSTITLIGALAGTALGTFTASGQVLNSNFVISSGNVTSFTTGFFLQSNLLVGYAAIDQTDITTANNQTGTNWENTFSLGTFKTTAVLNSNDVADTAGFADSDVVAGKLTTVSLSGLNPAAGTHITLGVGFRNTGGSGGKLTINGALEAPGFKQTAFNYFGLSG